MAFIIEDGSGLKGANSYASEAFALAYLTERNRQDENLWADLDPNVKQANLIAATDYIENRFRECFKGRKQFTSLDLAKAVLTIVANPIAASIVTLGSRIYTFVSTLTGADDVLIGINTSTSIDNLIDAIEADADGEGVTYGTGTLIHADITARAFEDDTMIAEAKLAGLAGNLLVSTTDIVGATWSSATLVGGTDTGRPQDLSFPRLSLFDRDGQQVVGIPDRLKFSTVEYAVRNASSVLQPDPDVVTGLQVVEFEEVVGPIKERTKWQPGGRVLISVPYPAADLLLREYIFQSGSVVRA